MTPAALGILLALTACALTACAPAAAAPDDAAPSKAPAARKWIDPSGDSIVSFGLLRVVPPAGGGSFRVRYTENPTEYAAGDQYQLFVLPGDAYAAKESAYGGEFLAFTRTEPGEADGTADLTVTFRAAAETTVIVAYGPWTAPDAGRPPGDRPTFSLAVSALDEKGAFEWVESEMGELITTNWTNRPEVARGVPVRDAVADADLFVEVRPMILYDGRFVRAAGEPPVVRPVGADSPAGGSPRDEADREEQMADLLAAQRRADPRIVMTRNLAEKFRRVPIRWR